MNKKYNFLLAEVLVALTILILFLGVVIDTPFLVAKKTFSKLQELELARLSQVVLCNTKIRLFEDGIPDKLGIFGTPTIVELYGQKLEQTIQLNIKDSEIRDKSGLITVVITYKNLDNSKTHFSKNFYNKKTYLSFEYKIFTKDLKNHAKKD